jgi:hypothetical protein
MQVSREDTSPTNEYIIDKLLGDNFKIFVNYLENYKLNMFTYEMVDKSMIGMSMNNKSPPPKSNDLHPSFMQTNIGILQGFKEIEEANITKSQIYENYINPINKLLDDLIKNKTDYNYKNFHFNQLPYIEDEDIPSIKYLIDCYHLLPYTRKFYSVDTEKRNSFILAIKFMQHLIALLNLDMVNIDEIMLILQHDNFYFMDYFYNFLENISKVVKNNIDINNYKIFFKGALEGFKGIADKIVKEMKEQDKSAINLFTDNYINITMDEFHNITINNYNDFIIGLGSYFYNRGYYNCTISASDNLIHSLLPAIVLETKGQDIDNSTDDIDKQNNYRYNSLLNPYYILDTKFKRSINVKIKINDNVKPIFPFPSHNKDDIDKFNSLPTLYGPLHVESDRYYLTNNMNHGNITNGEDGRFVTDEALRYVIYVIFKLEECYPENHQHDKIIVFILGILSYMIKHKYLVEPNHQRINIDQYDRNDIISIFNNMLNVIKYIHNREKIIPITDYDKHFKEYKDIFLSKFLKYVLNNLKNSAIQSLEGKPTNFNNPAVLYFFRNRILKEPVFYRRFFNLIRLKNVGNLTPEADVDFLSVKYLKDKDLLNYRLNIRKLKGETIFNVKQFGGNGNIDDIVYLTIIPDYPTDGSIGSIWITNTVRISKEDLKKIGTDAIYNLSKKVYLTEKGKDIPYNGITITQDIINESINYVSSFGLAYLLKNTDYIKNLLFKVPLMIPGLEQKWKRGENFVTEQMLKAASEWEREGDEFVRRDNEGKIVDRTMESLCGMIGEAHDSCLSFFTRCLNSQSDTLPVDCHEMLDFNFKINPAIDVLINTVKEINPIIAFRILEKFKFASYLADEESDPFPGFRRYKVQSVGEWLEELENDFERCKKPTAPSRKGCDSRTLREQLGDNAAKKILEMARDKKRHAFFDYLEILVHWVNANPQVLNKEEKLHPQATYEYPPIDKSFALYVHRDPYKPVILRLRHLRCELERLKSSIMNDLAGTRVPNTISLVAHTDNNINMPLSRIAFNSPIPSTYYVTMRGGNIEGTENELKNINQHYGHGLFKVIFDNLLQTMKGLSGEKKMMLKKETERKINEKLAKLKETEDELRNSLVRLLKKNQLYQASRGYVDAFSITDEADLEAVLRKHSNLLNLGAAYNRRAINIIDIFQTLAMAILNKLQETTQEPKYERPLTMSYHRS